MVGWQACNLQRNLFKATTYGLRHSGLNQKVPKLPANLTMCLATLERPMKVQSRK